MSSDKPSRLVFDALKAIQDKMEPTNTHAHRVEVIEGETGSEPGQSIYRMLCDDCDWHGQWRHDPFTAQRDGAAHILGSAGRAT